MGIWGLLFCCLSVTKEYPSLPWWRQKLEINRNPFYRDFDCLKAFDMYGRISQNFVSFQHLGLCFRLKCTNTSQKVQDIAQYWLCPFAHPSIKMLSLRETGNLITSRHLFTSGSVKFRHFLLTIFFLKYPLRM